MTEPTKRNRRGGRPKKKNDKDFFVVGIGASAGGIRALEQFFEKMSPTSGMAFVVIVHLSPEHESNLAQMLQRKTKMPVIQVTETVRVEPNHVYVTPPAKHLAMVDGTIGLLEPEIERGRRVPIDLFFRTLAQAYKVHSVGIVLSGTGTDGTLGLRRIKEDGGISIVQDPYEAEYDGMPRSAIESGSVDFVLPVTQMPEKLVAVREASEAIQLPPEGDKPPKGAEAEALREVLAFLRVRTGHDFINYKPSTILRRVTRRMQVNAKTTLAAYLQYMREHPAEVQDLLSDLLINVTNFFRDTEAFETLEQTVIPNIFEGKSESEQVRIWVAGCATGEEAYSLAILFQEHAERLDRVQSIQIFATDIDEESIGTAREGVFPDSISVDVTAERLKRYFTKEGLYYRIRKEIREMVLFAPHNVLRDPPFSKLDLVSCRNLLIYLNRQTQERVLELFHFALRPHGYLFLGASESADNLPELFTPVDKKLRIFKRSLVSHPLPYVPAMPVVGRWEVKTPEIVSPLPKQSFSYDELHHLSLEEYAPPSVLVNQSYDIVHLSDNAGRYLRFVGGLPTRNLLKVVHPDLRLDLRAALLAASQEGQPTESRRVTMRLDGEKHNVNLVVRPLTRPETARGYLLVVFDEADWAQTVMPPVEKRESEEGQGGEFGTVVHRLEEELQRTKDQLRTTIEQYETSTEELKASNEELQAINEELRSTTEELETSKEELQSVNEELTTVNHELKDKVDEVSRANADLQNLLASTDIGTIFLDRDLRIKRYTPRVAELFNIIPSDAGRPLAHLTHKLESQELTADAEEVLRTLARVEREVRSTAGSWFVARLSPYRTLEDKIDGVVLAFVDITERKKVEEALHERERFVSALTELAHIGISLYDCAQEQTIYVNPFIEHLLGYGAEEMYAMSGEQLGGLVHAEDLAAYQEYMEDCRRAIDGGMLSIEYRARHKSGEYRWLHAVGSPFRRDAEGKVAQILYVIEDVTEGKEAQALLRESEERFCALISQTTAGIARADLRGRLTFVNEKVCEMLGYEEAELLGKSLQEIIFSEDMEGTPPPFERLTATGEAFEMETRLLCSDGSTLWANLSISALLDAEGKPQSTVAVILDISERKRAERALVNSEERLRLLVESVKDYGIITMDLAGRITSWNPGAEQIFGYTAEEIIGKDIELIFTPEDRASAAPERERATTVAEGRAEDERWHARKDGSRFFASGVMTLLQDREKPGFVKVLRDLTVKQLSEEHLRESHEQLEERVKARTGELEASYQSLQDEVSERRQAEEQVKGLLRRIVNTQEIERQRISRDLHDHLGQQLTALKLSLELLREAVKKQQAARELTRQAQTITRQLDADIDFLAWELRPAALDDIGLDAALDSYVQNWAKHFRIKAEFHTSGGKPGSLNREVENNLYRIAQEALNNVAKHADAGRVDVLLEYHKEQVVLIIEDKGKGFDAADEATTKKGLGLLSIRERAALVGGSVTIETEPGDGTTVYVRVPIRLRQKGEQ